MKNFNFYNTNKKLETIYEEKNENCFCNIL